MAQERKQLIASALCKHLSLDPKSFLEDCDVKSLCSNIFKSSSVDCNDEVMKWIAYAESFPTGSEACVKAIKSLNDELVQKSVLLGNGFKVSEADVIVYSVIHSYVIALSKSERQNIPCVLRWMDYVQNKENFGDIFEKVPVEKAIFEPPAPKAVAAAAETNSNAKGPSKDAKADTNSKKDAAKGTKSTDALKAEKNLPKDTSTKKGKGDKGATEAGQKKAETESASKDDVPVTLLNIKVGVIRKAQKHPSADSLLIEEIDVGESKVRQVVSGLAKFCNPEDLVNRRVVLITNVKPGKLRDVVSEGLVLCASNEDHSAVEPLLPPEGAKVGERVCFAGHEGKPEDVLNPKKKQLDKITPHLFTDENGVATYKGIPFMTSGGPCTSSIRKGSVK